MRQKRVCPETEALNFISSGRDKDTFYKRYINKEKGYGVFTSKNIEPGEFLLEYSGKHITGSEGEALFKKYSDANAAFLYFYSFQGKTCCVDGSKNTQLGRFINDDHINPNSKIKIVMDEKKSPHLCVFATTKINAGEEIVYDYGDPNCPWRHTTKAPSSNVHMEKKIRSERKNVPAEQQQAEENQGEDMHTDQLHSSHSSPQIPEKMDISQSDVCVYPEMTDTHLSHIPEELCSGEMTQSEQKNVPGEQPEQHQAEKNQGQDTHTDILCSSYSSPQTTDDTESILSIHPEMTGTHLRDSSSPTKEELTLDEMMKNNKQKYQSK
ncbi:uncharacterized protein LOC118564814 [Fundulus heteroclitus]|uniref:uncharacterized protein LOC118564814 n=1 Tax=Fundulus heteroclitus TaxID=8078 RepID=UPI00165B19B9|nr:uncharacterized protein LOC118564814 [Fundulus heteroclitus]